VSKVRILKSDDWVEVFVDDELFEEGHHYDPVELMVRLGIEVDYQYVDRCRYCTEVFPEDSLRDRNGVCKECHSEGLG